MVVVVVVVVVLFDFSHGQISLIPSLNFIPEGLLRKFPRLCKINFQTLKFFKGVENLHFNFKPVHIW